MTQPPPPPGCYSYRCLACQDRGIIQNQDGAINLFPGLDTYDDSMNAALICTCPAAYAKRDDTGAIILGGFRDDSGAIKTMNTPAGARSLGTEPPVGMVDWLLERRRASYDAMQEPRTHG